MSKGKILKIGYGKCFASFGELAQGRLSNGSDFLITLPIDLWSICDLTCKSRNGKTTIKCKYEKSTEIAKKIVNDLGLDYGFDIEIKFLRSIPIGKGMSSSTADMISVYRAFQEVFGFIVTSEYLSKVFSEIEPHDGLMYKSCVGYDHRIGKLLSDFKYVPQFEIVAVDGGGTLDTLQYNQNLLFSETHISQYDILYESFTTAFANKDDKKIAKLALEATRLQFERTERKILKYGLDEFENLGASGVISTHSGTCVGFIFMPGENEKIKKAEDYIAEGSVLSTKTLKFFG